MFFFLSFVFLEKAYRFASDVSSQQSLNQLKDEIIICGAQGLINIRRNAPSSHTHKHVFTHKLPFFPELTKKFFSCQPDLPQDILIFNLYADNNRIVLNVIF